MAFLEEYTLLDELGQGGYATVYKVRHNNLGYIRAVRVLNAIIAHGENDKTYQKFLEECRLLLRLGNGNHPNIVHIYQPLLKAQRAIVEMDFVDGKDLYHYLEKKHTFVNINDVLKLLTDIGSALAYCHEDIYRFCMDKEEDDLQDDPNDGKNVLLDEATKQRLVNKYRVIHNDIHSGNIIRREDGSYVLLDFGLAIEGDSVIRSSRRKNGAPEFKAPEKWDNDSILTPQSDIYSFGVVLYEYLAGRVPFLFDKKNSNTVEAEYLLGKAHKEQLPAPIFELRKAAFEHAHPGETYEKDYPDWLETLIFKCLAKSIENRFKNGRELYSFVLEHLGKDTNVLVQQLQNKVSALQEQVLVLEKNGNAPAPETEELIAGLKSQLKDVLFEKNSVEIQVKKLQTENSTLKEQLEGNTLSAESDAELLAKVVALESEISKLNSELKKAEEKYIAATKKLSADNDHLEIQVKNLRVENASLKELLDKKAGPAGNDAVLLGKIAALESEISALNGELEKAKASYITATEKQALDKEYLEIQVKNLQLENASLKELLGGKAGSESNEAEYKRRVAELEGEIAELEGKITELSNELKSTEERYLAVNENLSNAIKDNETLKKENVALKKSSGGVSAVWKRISIFLMLLVSVFILLITLITISSPAQKTEAKPKAVTATSANNKNTIKKLQDEIATKDAEITKLTGEVAALEKKLAKEGTPASNVKSEIVLLKKQLATMQEKNEELSKQINEKDRLIKVLNSQIGVK